MLKSFLVDESGATAIEYGLLMGLIVILLIASFTLVGDGVIALFETGAANTMARQTELIP